MSKPLKPLNEISEEELKNHPGRYRGRTAAPKPKGRLGPPPAWMSAAQKAMWTQVEKEAPALLGATDRTRMEVVAILKVKLSRSVITTAEMALLLATQKELGFNGLDRASRRSWRKTTTRLQNSRRAGISAFVSRHRPLSIPARDRG
jgi:hypothetical protein